jgi:hypothetical protein
MNLKLLISEKMYSKIRFTHCVKNKNNFNLICILLQKKNIQITLKNVTFLVGARSAPTTLLWVLFVTYSTYTGPEKNHFFLTLDLFSRLFYKSKYIFFPKSNMPNLFWFIHFLIRALQNWFSLIKASKNTGGRAKLHLCGVVRRWSSLQSLDAKRYKLFRAVKSSCSMKNFLVGTLPGWWSLIFYYFMEKRYPK